MPEKILIVDDDLETLRLVGLMLQRQGYEIVVANSGKQALNFAKSEAPDLIVLDIMMPEMDGFQVSQFLRKDPALTGIPILMFTAKSQVDDKVAGYDAGADDYLTKPVHPAELVAHIKALLTRTRSRPAPLPAAQRGYAVGIIGCKGGMGISTLTLNLAASYAQKTKTEVIAAEMRVGQGSWGPQLGFAPSNALETILRMNPSEITPAEVEKHLVGTAFGVRLLLASDSSMNVDFAGMTDRSLALVNSVTLLGPMSFLDLGTSFLPGYEKLCNVCSELIVVTDPVPATVMRTKVLLGELRSFGYASGKMINIVLINRVRSEMQLNSIQVSDMLNGEAISMMIPSVPEQAYQADQKQSPLVKVHPDGLAAQQIGNLAELIKTHVG